MKRRYIAMICALAASMLVVSCYKDPLPEEMIDVPQEGIILKLAPIDMGLSTKATNTDPERPGDFDGSFNENKLGSEVDVFFFPDGADYDTPSVYNKRTRVSQNGFVQLPISAGDITTIFGSNSVNAESRVLVIANYSEDEDEVEAINHENHYTVNQLRALSLATATWKSEFPQSKFVMLSDNKNAENPSPLVTLKLTAPNSATPASGTVYMKRVAAKVTFRLTVADEIKVVNVTRDQSGHVTDRSLETWTPLKNAMTAYMQYAMKVGTLGGEPQSPPDVVPLAVVPDNHPTLMAYESRNLVVLDPDDKISRTRIPVTGLTEDDPPQPTYGEPVESDFAVYQVAMGEGSGQTAGPFYTYPITWTPGVPGEPFIKLIIPWNNGQRTKYYYYKIPFKSAPLESNHWYEITLDVQILGGEDTDPVPLEATYKVVDWVSGSHTSATVNAARYLSVPNKSFTMYNTEDLVVPMLSSHPCEIDPESITIIKHNFKNNTDQSFPASILQKLEVISQEEIDFKHTLNNDIGPNLDCAPYIISFRVRQIDEPEYYADVTITQYPSIYIKKSAGGNAFVDGYYTLVTGGKPDQSANTHGGYYYHYGSFSVDNGRRVTPYGNLSGRANGNQESDGNYTVPSSETENTKIYVTAFTQTSNSYTFDGETKQYIIGDPRIPFMSASQIESKTITNYLTPNGTGGATTAWTQDQLNALKVGTNVDNIIAPAFMFASEWGRQGNQASGFQTVAKRCATYQEKGYPAGRWRLTTQAEVAFVANLQANNFIGELFGGGQYWISNGRALSISGSNITPQNSGNSTRCVYDIWYWGEDPVVSPDYLYAVMP